MISGKWKALPSWLSNEGPETDVVVSTRVRLARNLAQRSFPARCSSPERTQVFEDITNSLKSSSRFRGYEYLNFSSLPELHQRALVERRAGSAELLKARGDRGVVTGDRFRVCIMINEEDHIRIQCFLSGCLPEAAWGTVSEIDDDIGSSLEIAYDSRRGFLSSCATNSGTGLRISFLLHLPALILTRSIDQVLQAVTQMGVSVRGFFGEHSDVIGAFFQLSNHAAMGAEEEQFVADTHGTVQEVMRLEREARESIVNDAREELEDKVYRACGALRYARLLELNECISLLSALRLGLHCGIVQRPAPGRLNELLLDCLPAHMQMELGRGMNDDEINRHRAERARSFMEEWNI